MVTFYRTSVCFRFHCHDGDLEQKAFQPTVGEVTDQLLSI